MTRSSLGLNELISRSIRRAGRRFIYDLILIFVVLEAFVITSEYETSKRRLNEWIILNRPQIEQALFLENALSLEGLVDQFNAPASDAFYRSLTIFDVSGKPIRGFLTLPQKPLPEGFAFELIPPRIRYFSPLQFGGKSQGSLLIYGSFRILSPLFHTLLAVAICALILLMFRKLVTQLIEMTNEQAVQPLQRLKDAMNAFAGSGRLDKFALEPEARLASEIHEVSLGFNAMAETIEAYSRRERSAAAILAKQDLAAQAEPHLLADLAEEVIAEKRIQLRARLDLELKLRLQPEQRSLFASVDAVEFRRVLSNLIDNSVEAIEGAGEIRISLAQTNDGQRIQLQIEDNGRGIPAEVLRRVGDRGLSVGKRGGSGLGLFHAKQALEQWNGSLELRSPLRDSRGTCAILELPFCERPDWFATQIDLRAVKTVVIIDDDESIHLLWKRRLAEWLENGTLQLQQYIDPDSAFESLKSKIKASETLFLVDYEFSRVRTPQIPNGLSLIQSLRIGPESFLVTSHADDRAIRSQCVDHGVQIIPKSLATWIPIRG